MHSKEDCANCPIHHTGNLIKLGIEMGNFDYVVALAGNPNTGKSTIFNSLTGLKQHTGNWPGKTVARAEGGYSYQNELYKTVDLPGTYSLLSTSADEEIARNFILFGQPDVTVIVVDATRLERNLNLVLQILEITERVVIAVNLMDEAKRHNIEISMRGLSKKLGVPVVPTSARSGEGITELIQKVAEVAKGSYVCHPFRQVQYDKKVEEAIHLLQKKIENRFKGISNARWVAMRLLEGDNSIIEAIQNDELTHLV